MKTRKQQEGGGDWELKGRDVHSEDSHIQLIGINTMKENTRGSIGKKTKCNIPCIISRITRSYVTSHR